MKENSSAPYPKDGVLRKVGLPSCAPNSLVVAGIVLFISTFFVLRFLSGNSASDSRALSVDGLFLGNRTAKRVDCSYEAPHRMLSDSEVAESRARTAEFARVSEKGMWGHPQGPVDGEADTVSGGGSFLSVTATARVCIAEWLVKYKIWSVLDVPCGDALWQGLVHGFGGGRYTGADISMPALQRAMSRPRNQAANMRFRWMDVTMENIDGCQYDAVMFRDFIQHLSLSNGIKAISNACQGGVRYLIASTFPDTLSNEAQDVLQPSHKNNLRIAPYNLPPPLEDCDNHVELNDGSRLQLFDLQGKGLC